MLQMQQKEDFMEKYLNTLKNCKLFSNISEYDILKSLECLNSYVKEYKKDDIIYNISDKVNKIGIILEGSVIVSKEDSMGNRVILTKLFKSSLFGETFVCSDNQYSPVTVISSDDSKILFIDFNSIIYTCKNNCSFHSELIKNMLKVIANKNLLLNEKIEILSSKTTKDKLMTYLNLQKTKYNSNKFSISYNREQLADFLNLNRSNMSRELSKMKKENIIKYNKNIFEILI
jgi:CRP/FNR family transcriptional regulator, dissimilatory nitrate respiration regulator